MRRNLLQGLRAKRASASLGLALAVLIACLIAPVGVVATGPEPITLDQATASTIADRWFPIVLDADVPPGCLYVPEIECPGGVPRAPSTNLRFTRASLAAQLLSPTDFGVTADLRVATPDPIVIDVAGSDCDLAIDSSAGTSPTIRATTQGSLRSSTQLDYEYIESGDIEVEGLEFEDVAVSGTGLVCGLVSIDPTLLAAAVDILATSLYEHIQSEGPLCGAPAPELVATCPWFTLGPSLDFGDQAVGSSSAPRRITLTNAGPGYPFSIDIGQITIAGAAAGDFSISADGCSTFSLLPGSCTLDVTFVPSAGGTRSAQLNVPSSWVESPGVVELTGVGVVPTADVSVGVSAAAGGGKAKGQMTYSLTVSNAGPSTATGITVEDSLPAQTAFVSVTAGQGTCTAPAVGTSGAIICSIGSLASGSSTQIQIVVTVTARRVSITNTVTVSSTTSDPDPADNTASVTTRVK